MAATNRQNNLLINQDWTVLYESFRNADFQSYDFQTLRKAMLDYIQLYYPENFNDFVESSEYIALIDLIAFLGQNLAFRTDLNARENFIDTAERRDSVIKLAKLISYNPKRNLTSTGFLKFTSVQTSERIIDSNGIDLSNLVVKWNDGTNPNWYEQFVTVLNATLPNNQQIGKPANSQLISGVVTDEYNISLPGGTLPIFPFSATVDGANLPFEIISGTSVDKTYIYESSPSPGKPLNIIYKNDNLGNASNNTGFFFYFKQGTSQNQTISFLESIPNNLVSVNINNINNTDVWLYEINNQGQDNLLWNQIPAVVGQNIIYNNNAPQKSYQVVSRDGDQIDLVFGDGTFAAIPAGNYRVYYRVSSGLSYNITPDEMTNVRLNIPYISKSGKAETLTVIANLKYTVANAQPRESLADIRTKAPQLYYTQNRMITAEDYNVFPYGAFSSISRVKAVNRTSSGISRYLDVIDTTGRYSSTNIFAADGIVFQQDDTSSFTFTFTTTSDVNRMIENQLLPLVRGQSMLQFYYSNFEKFIFPNLNWARVTPGSGSCTGYFYTTSTSQATAVGTGTALPYAYITEGSVIVLYPGVGKYFNSANEIETLPSDGIIPANGQPILYATVLSLSNNGTQVPLANGQGPVTISLNLPSSTGSVPEVICVFPAFNNSFTTALKSQIITNVTNYSSFGLRFDQRSKAWAIIDETDLDLNSNFSLDYQYDTSNRQRNSSWLISLQANGVVYTITARGLNYVFESVAETKFYFDNRLKIFDPITGYTVNDSIKVLKLNGNANTNQPLNEDFLFYVYNQIVEEDGYVDSSKILITYSDINDNGAPDDPDIFQNIVMPILNLTSITSISQTLSDSMDINPITQITDPTKLVYLYQNGQIFYIGSSATYWKLNIATTGVRTLQKVTSNINLIDRKFVYFKRTLGYDKFITYEPVRSGTIISEYPTKISLAANIQNYNVGQIFYTYEDETFYEITLNGNTRSLTRNTNYIVKTGRVDLYFQYKHNAPGDRRIDPSPSNLIDLYILTKDYENSFRAWALDTTGKIQMPDRPTGESLKIEYGTLDNYKSVSDSIIYNAAKFKLLFGNKANNEFRATFKVVKNNNINLSDFEIRSQVLAYINAFFAVGNWDFGETFYFTELATFIQQGMAPSISSIIIVPNSINQTYGSLQQIGCEPDEIFLSCATVENIEVISAITAAQLNLEITAVNSIIT
jgi:hypothetical protein